MASSSYRRLFLLAGWGLLLKASTACGPRAETEITAPRLLHRLCSEPSTDCRLTGAARLVPGLTADTFGVQLGPGPGSLEIRWPPASQPNVASRSNSNLLQVLARGNGRLAPSPNASILREEFDWYESPEQPPTPDAGTGEEPAVFVQIAASSGNQTIDVVDVRQVSAISYNCSVARVGVPRR